MYWWLWAILFFIISKIYNRENQWLLLCSMYKTKTSHIIKFSWNHMKYVLCGASLPKKLLVKWISYGLGLRLNKINHIQPHFQLIFFCPVCVYQQWIYFFGFGDVKYQKLWIVPIKLKDWDHKNIHTWRESNLRLDIGYHINFGVKNASNRLLVPITPLNRWWGSTSMLSLWGLESFSLSGEKHLNYRLISATWCTYTSYYATIDPQSTFKKKHEFTS